MREDCQFIFLLDDDWFLRSGIAKWIVGMHHACNHVVISQIAPAESTALIQMILIFKSAPEWISISGYKEFIQTLDSISPRIGGG